MTMILRLQTNKLLSGPSLFFRPSTFQKYHTKTEIYGYKPRKGTQYILDDQVVQKRVQNSCAFRLVQAYRQHGHKSGQLDPLGLKEKQNVSELNPQRYGIALDSATTLDLNGILYNSPVGELSPQELVDLLEAEYCGTITAEFDHLMTEEEREWFAEKFECKSQLEYHSDRKLEVAKLLMKGLTFDRFLNSKFTTLKFYGGEGAEAMLCFFDEIFGKCATNGISNVVIGMPHRGRLSFMATMLGYPVATMLRKIKGLSEFPPGVSGSGDVLSHLYKSVDLTYCGNNVHVSLLPNPSHLDAVSPVAAGKTRGKLQSLNSGDYSPKDSGDNQVLCVQVHGDGSFSGQGVISETFTFAEVPHFSVGGSLHLIVNNQVGYTTEEHYGRSSLYCSDIAKINSSPVLHVNGDYPLDVLKATSIAMDYRLKFQKDVVVEIICYRRAGHNEMDEPSFTQPLMYKAIKGRQSMPENFAEEATKDNETAKEDLSKAVKVWVDSLSQELNNIDNPVRPYHLEDQWSSYVQSSDQLTSWDTGLDLAVLKYIGSKSVEVPQSVHVHPTIQKTHIERRLQRLEEGKSLDWSSAEALAIGSLLYQGYNVRISGQDVGRGTFSQRHAMIVDQSTDEITIPLNHITPDQKGFLEMANSVLSEEAVLGFEYGLSLESPLNLVIWEAQFGDFFNGAQIMIDTFITSGESKWLLQSGLVLLLPHGYDGAGPEHTSCRIERFLQMTDSKEDAVDGDNVNFQVVNPTTPAQYFHLLRQQMLRNYRKPLIVVAPKILLRYPAAVSSLHDMGSGTSFRPVIGDENVPTSDVKHVIFCSGKHYYTLYKEREIRGHRDTALVRLESLCPFPAGAVREEINKYSKAKQFTWSQEEHRNMGAWSFVTPRFQNILGVNLRYAGRGILGVPAVGIGEIHQKEMEDIIDRTFQ